MARRKFSKKGFKDAIPTDVELERISRQVQKQVTDSSDPIVDGAINTADQILTGAKRLFGRKKR